MTTMERIVRCALLILALGSVFLAGDGLRLLAEWRVSQLNGIFMLNAGLLAAVVFAYRATDFKYAEPLSIIKSH